MGYLATGEIFENMLPWFSLEFLITRKKPMTSAKNPCSSSFRNNLK